MLLFMLLSTFVTLACLVAFLVREADRRKTRDFVFRHWERKIRERQ